MIQEQIYKKDINRVIDGVIKADSVTKLKDEITEYVITAIVRYFLGIKAKRLCAASQRVL